MTRISRNQKCPCGSGLRYKECHGNLKHNHYKLPRFATQQIILGIEKNPQNQNLGKKVIESGANMGARVVIVGNRMHHIDSRSTFHDFLLINLADVLEKNEVAEELFSNDHPVSIWRQKFDTFKNSLSATSGEVVNVPQIGAGAALLHLAYDVYALKHNADFQAKLVKRLHHRNLFIGARYEVQVAAIMVRAGFSIEFEDEDSRQSTHCEFTATHLHSGKKFSVEAKKSVGSRNKSTGHVSKALRKAADHERIVFVDLNMPHLSSNSETPEFGKNAIRKLRDFERTDPEARDLPPAYVFVTNVSHEHHLDSENWKFLVLTEGFKIGDFKMDGEFTSLRAEISAYEKHREMHELRESIFKHTEPPMMFDAQCPPLAFGNVKNPPAIGESYVFKGPNDIDVEGILVSVKVSENEKIVVCEMVDASNNSFFVKKPFSDVEMATWRESPNKYFRKIFLPKTVRTMAERYFYYMEKCRFMSTLELLGYIRNPSDRAVLNNLDRMRVLEFVCKQETENDVLVLGPAPKNDFNFYFDKDID